MAISDFFKIFSEGVLAPIMGPTLSTQAISEQMNKDTEEIDALVNDDQFFEIAEQAVLADTEKIAIQAWAVIVAMWNKIPKSIRTAVKFILWILILTGISIIPFMILIIHYLYTFIKNNPELLLAL